MKHPFFLLIFILLNLTSLFSTDRDIALIYQKKVWETLEIDKARSRELLDTGLTYDDDLSGFWYAKGIFLENEMSLVEASKAYGKAMILDDWEGADFDVYLDRYFSLLSRLALWDEILESMNQIGFYRVNHQQVLLSSAWAEFYKGNEAEAAEKASRGINLYPGDPRFYTLRLACGGDKTVLDGYLYYWGDRKEDLYSTVYTLNKLRRLPVELEEFYILEGHDDLSRYLELKKSLSKNQKSIELLENYLDNQSDYDLDLLWELYSLADLEGKSLIERTLLNFSGDYYSDRDGDFYKEMTLNRNRVLSIDRDRDGLFETRIELTEFGKPQSWSSQISLESRRDIAFFTWPLVEKVTRITTYGEQHFHFLYPRFNLDREDLSIFLYDEGNFSLMVMLKVLQNRDLSIPWEKILNSSYTLQEFKGETLYRIYGIHNGEILGIEEDSLGNGIIDRQVLMSGGEIEAARRDLDQDGKYDLFEYYEKGVWKGYAINLNGKSWSDFYHDWSVIPLKIWDFDKDHIINSYSLESYNGEEKIIKPQVEDVIGVDDLLYWEKKFEAQWYR